jgi:acetyltransferase-like isoleucine patch superfamily enzyme
MKSLPRRILNRMLHGLARILPGATTLRPTLHRWRGVKVGRDVFIGEDVYLENEFPEAVRIEDGAQLSIRVVLIAHTRGAGEIIVGKNAYLGPNAVVATSAGRRLRIGEGAVIGAGVVVTSDVADQMFVPSHPAKPVARATVPLAAAKSMAEFVRGLVPLKSAARDSKDKP